jgi:signal transduction histidine kinase
VPSERSTFLVHFLPVITVAAVACVSVLDLLAGGPSLLGLLACGPVLVASVSDDRRAVWITSGAAVLGSGLVAISGTTTSPAWTVHRAVVLFCLLATALLAALLQRRRLSALALRDRAISASELNRLLMSLLAHDLRAPLSLADQGFHYVEDSVNGGYPIDRALVGDVRARLQRSLRAIEMVLSLGREELGTDADAPSMLRSVSLRHEIGEEVASFAYEAQARGKTLELELTELGGTRHLVNVAVLRQALAIPLDNAVRYAAPGRIRVTARTIGERLEVRVEDGGPGISAHRGGGAPSGSGLGLRLCGTLLARAGGALHVERDSEEGTSLLVTLPVQPGATVDPASDPMLQPVFST